MSGAKARVGTQSRVTEGLLTSDLLHSVAPPETLKNFLDDVTPAGILDAITITNTGTTIEWTAGEIYTPTQTIVEIAAGSAAGIDGGTNHIYWDAGTAAVIVSLTPPDEDDDVPIGTACVQDGEVWCIHHEPTIATRVPDIQLGLAENFPTTVTGGLEVTEDTNGDNPLDVECSEGTYWLDVHAPISVPNIKTRIVPLVRWYHSGGAWTHDTDAEIDTSQYDDGADLQTYDAARWGRSMFLVSMTAIHWIYPLDQYTTENAALDADLPSRPPGLGDLPAVTAYVIRKDDAAFVASSDDRWQDIRVIVGQLATGAGGGVRQLTDLSDVTAVTGSGTTVAKQNTPLLLAPTIASFVNANHDHEDAVGGGLLPAYPLLAGRAGGQTLIGGGVGDDLTLQGGTSGDEIILQTEGVTGMILSGDATPGAGATGSLFVGNTKPAAVAANELIISAQEQFGTFAVYTCSSSDLHSSGASLRRAHGTLASPTALHSGNDIGAVSFAAWDDSANTWRTRASILCEADANHVGASCAMRILFRAGVTGQAECFRVESDADALVAGDNRWQFRDASTYIYSRTANHLNLNASSALQFQKSGTVMMEMGDRVLTFISGAGANTSLKWFTSQRLDIRSGTTNVFSVSNVGSSHYNAAPVAQQDVVGSRGGNVALANLLTALATWGAITDSTT